MVVKMSWEIILKELACPRATQDLKLNTKNRNAAIKAKHIQYGPLNLSDEGYWEEYAKKWGPTTTAEEAKQSNCSNCIAFDVSPRMKKCMPLEGDLGYCWMHDFKCHKDRTCYTWAAGGPIDDDKTSKENQMKGG
tara:strand:- start:53 stop:457 length:405 start_codon:yes stop_codon:yes gene_type:complete